MFKGIIECLSLAEINLPYVIDVVLYPLVRNATCFDFSVSVDNGKLILRYYFDHKKRM